MSPRTFALIAPLCLVLSTALQAERVGSVSAASSADTTVVQSTPTAQSTPSADTSSVAATTAPSVQDLPAAAAIAAPAGLQRQQQLTHDLSPVPSAENNGPNVAMMIVGGAAIVVGAVIGGTPGTLFMVGGGVVGLYGLWKFLQ